jgi:hypothetical protein
MKEVPEKTYNESIANIYHWYQGAVYNDEDYNVELTALPVTHLKLIEVSRKLTGGLYHKVLVKATYDNIRQSETPHKNVQELNYLYNTKTANEPYEHTAHQLLWVQLDHRDQPTDALLFTWSPNDESYHKFEIW